MRWNGHALVQAGKGGDEGGELPRRHVAYAGAF